MTTSSACTRYVQRMHACQLLVRQPFTASGAPLSHTGKLSRAGSTSAKAGRAKGYCPSTLCSHTPERESQSLQRSLQAPAGAEEKVRRTLFQAWLSI